MKKTVSAFVLLTFLFSGMACNTNKPAEEVIDAKDRVKTKVQQERDEQQKAAEEAGQ